MIKQFFSFAFALSFILSTLHNERTLAQATIGNVSATANIPAPEDVLSFRPGDDRKLASWSSIIDYFQKLDAASDRVQFEELGRTTMNAPFVMATISAPENLARLNDYKEIQRKLADPRTLGKNADAKAKQLIARGKTIVLITCGIHSTEVGSYLSSTLIAHRLASSNEPEIQETLRNTIILLVPSLNPDGVDIVKNWYDRTLGTPYEGTNPPELYHKYVGHDNNRDWYAFTQVETRITVDKIHNVWHPQIVHDIHQQGAYNARLFVPPYMPPVEPNVPKQIIEGYTELGNHIAKEMRAAGFKGITTNSSYDAWTPARAYSHYHGGVRILSETASARLASPITVRFEDLRPDEGYDPRKTSPNFPELWPGGEWRLRDITNYMTTAAFSLLRHASQNRERWLQRFYEIGKEAVRPRKSGELFAILLLPTKDKDQEARRLSLMSIMSQAGVTMETLDPANVRGNPVLNSLELFIPPPGRRKSFSDLAVIIRMDQPYGAFAKALLESQNYPNLRNSAGEPITPYDVTAHTLPLLMGVETKMVYEPFRYNFAGFKTEFPVAPSTVESRSAIYKSYVPSMDEGWTRWVFERNKIRYSSLSDAETKSGNLKAKFDTIIIPDHFPRALLEGHKRGTMPDEYTGGLGTEGVNALREFVEGGGTLVCLNRASIFAIEQFKLPVRNAVEGLKRTGFYVPGSILRTELDQSHPLAAGMPKESIAWVEDSPVFEVSNQAEASRVKVIARYPENKDALLSGWLLGGEKLKGKAALVEVALGKGRIYLFGFRPQYRGQSMATYPLLFNAIR